MSMEIKTQNRALDRRFSSVSLLRILKSVIKDPVVLSLIAALAILAVINRQQFNASLIFTGNALVYIAPYFALAMGFAAFAKASGADSLMVRAFSGRPLYAITAATLAGALSPFCSCGVIPLIAGMLAAGVPLAPVMAFWVSSPIMDPEMFILTTAGIGLNFAIAKTFAAIGMGLLAGTITQALDTRSLLKNPLNAGIETGCGTLSCTPRSKAIMWAFWRDSTRREIFWNEVKSVGGFLGKWMTLAFFLESLMVAYIDPAMVSNVAGEGNAFAIPLAALIGMPSYLNGYAAIPLASGLLDLGMSKGAALAFLTAGAVSSIPAAIAVYSLVKKPVFALYIVLGLTGSLITGFAYQFSGLSI
jgi:uncharacterized protein